VVVLKSHVPVKVDWLKDNKPVKIDGVKYATAFEENDYSFTLNVNKSAITDAGSYSVNVSNIFGKATSQARLLIRCKLNLILNMSLFKFIKLYLFFK
jgi:hypothetical protein